MKTISIGSDHAGFLLKEAIINHLKANYQVQDLGTTSSASVDYPDYAFLVSKDVVEERADFGILICYTGIGMSIAANKVKGIRAALVGKIENAILTREHNNANVLCLSSKDTAIPLALQIVDAFLQTSFLGERHARRIQKITEIEK